MITQTSRSGNDRPATAAIEMSSIAHVDGQLFGKIFLVNGKRHQLIRIRCPICGLPHTHGWAVDEGERTEIRRAHCRRAPGQYHITAKMGGNSE